MAATPVAPPGQPEKTPEELAEIKRQKQIAFRYGLKDGLRFWELSLIKYNDIPTLNTSPEIKQALTDWYWEYTQGAQLLQYVVAISTIVYLAVTNMPALVKLGLSAAGLGGIV